MQIKDMLKAAAKAPREPKPLKPLKTPDGTVIPETGTEPRLDSDEIPTALLVTRRDDPYAGKRCSVSRCRETPQWTVSTAVPDFEAPELPRLRNTDPLTARIEAAMAHRQAGVMVPDGESFHLCIKHFTEYQAARAEQIAAARKAAEPQSWHLADLDYSEGARIEFLDGEWFRITDAQGRTMKLEVVMHLAEVTARLAGKDYRIKPLNAAEREHFVKTVKDREIAEGVINKLQPYAGVVK